LNEKFKLICYKNCLYTIVNNKYIIDFETMLYLFHKHNNWFNGDILVIQDDKYSILSYEYKDKITCHYNGLNELKDIFDI